MLADAAQLVIDAHCHAGSGEPGARHWNTIADPAIILRHMSEAGIDRSIIFPLGSPNYERANREIAEICAGDPGKFIGFARHDPATEGSHIHSMLKREVQGLGLKGLKLSRHPPREVLDAVEELGIPVIYHAERVLHFNMIAEAYPRISFIVAHMGSHNNNWGDHIEAINMARYFPNVYLDTSGVAFYKYLERAIKEAGAAKLIFGSDGPEYDSRVELYKIKLLKLPPADEAKVLGGNIARLLPKGTV